MTVEKIPRVNEIWQFSRNENQKTEWRITQVDIQKGTVWMNALCSNGLEKIIYDELTPYMLTHFNLPNWKLLSQRYYTRCAECEAEINIEDYLCSECRKAT